MKIVKYRNLFFAVSALIIIPGLIALWAWGLKLGIDFAGGSLYEVRFHEQQPTAQEVQNYLASQNLEIASTASTSETSVLIRTKLTEESKVNEMKTKLQEQFGTTEEIRLETVGPTISGELTKKAVTAVVISIVAIVIYVSWSFRKVPKPASGLIFGISTIAALGHDVVVTVGSFSILGYFLNIEIDSLFITALLTVLGFSVHDTIVVLDRIRENLKTHPEHNFEQIVDHSIVQTMTRSLNTSLTVVFVLVALLLFGGDSIKSFVLALLIGIISGAYSSIFFASPLLVVLQNLKFKRGK